MSDCDRSDAVKAVDEYEATVGERCGDRRELTLPASATRRPLTERRMARTRRELADAAARLFIERGYDQTTVEDIVAEVEISARTFFRYFGSKEEVVASLWRWGVEEIVDALRAVPPDQPLQEALRIAVAAACQHAAENPAQTRSFLLMVRDTPALRARRLQVAYGQQQDLAVVPGGAARPAGDGSSGDPDLGRGRHGDQHRVRALGGADPDDRRSRAGTAGATRRLPS